LNRKELSVIFLPGQTTYQTTYTNRVKQNRAMGKTPVAAATAALLLNLCISSYGQKELSTMNNQRRSLRSGMAGADDVTKNGEPGQDVKFHTKISTTTKKNAVPKQKWPEQTTSRRMVN
jgi:hypothetical protein